MSTPQQHPLIGRVIAERYRVLELLAEGGMGAVYIAEHLTLHKEVALKVVHPEHAGNEELIARFAREAMATSRIDHPNVISALDFGKLPDGTAYLAVQLVRGPSLTRVLRAEKRLPWARAAAIGMQIADALDAAHGHGIVHRDLKPDNVLLQYRDDGSELVKVLDFGVAKFAPESKVPLAARRDVTQVGMVVGTPGYMAPEQTIGNPADERSDLYALGVILWEALVGQPLWSAEDLQGLVERQMSETPKLVREAISNPDIPEELEALIAELLARRAEERPSSAALVREALREHAAHNIVEFERPRWRTGARPVPSSVRAAASSERPLPALTPPPTMSIPRAPAVPRLEAVDDSAPTLIVQDMEIPTQARVRSPLPPPRSSPGPKPTVPPPPPPRLTTYRVPPESSRIPWLLAALLGTIVSGVVVGFATGRLSLNMATPRVEQPAALGQAPEPPAAAARPVPSERATTQPTLAEAGQPQVAQEPAEPLFEPGDLPRPVNDTVEVDDEPIDAGTVARLSLAQRKGMYIVHLQRLQRAKTCEGKRVQIDALGVLGDQRAVPALKRLYARPRTGCGKRQREDCFGCLRRPLEAALEKLAARKSGAAK